MDFKLLKYWTNTDATKQYMFIYIYVNNQILIQLK